MKIRTGFVSNSSSSSFVAILRKDNFDKLVKNLSPIARAAQEYLSVRKKKLDGVQMVIYSHTSSDETVLIESEDLEMFIDNALAFAVKNSEIETQLSEISKQLHSIDDIDIEFVDEGVNELFDEGINELQSALSDLAEKGKCIIHRDSF
jgi:hypothetical protein